MWGLIDGSADLGVYITNVNLVFLVYLVRPLGFKIKID